MSSAKNIQQYDLNYEQWYYPFHNGMCRKRALHQEHHTFFATNKNDYASKVLQLAQNLMNSLNLKPGMVELRATFTIAL